MIPTNEQIIELLKDVIFNPTITAQGGSPEKGYQSFTIGVTYGIESSPRLRWSQFVSWSEKDYEIVDAPSAQELIDKLAAETPEARKSRKVAELKAQLEKLTA